MSAIRLNFKALSFKKSEPKEFFRKAAKNVINKYNKEDKNFIYFILELIELSKDSLNIEDIRSIISYLQKYTCKRINEEQEVVYVPIKNKIKVSKKNYFDKFEFE